MQVTRDEHTCDSCAGTGEMGTEFGTADCADCGGSGVLPPRSVLIDWRARDIERALTGGLRIADSDVKWLIAELRAARGALTEVLALAHDLPEAEVIGGRIRAISSRTLGHTGKKA